MECFLLYDEKQRPIFNWTFFYYDFSDDVWWTERKLMQFYFIIVCCYESVSIIIFSVSDAFVRNNLFITIGHASH